MSASPASVQGARLFASLPAPALEGPAPSAQKSTTAMVPMDSAKPKIWKHSAMKNSPSDSSKGFSTRITRQFPRFSKGVSQEGQHPPHIHHGNPGCERDTGDDLGIDRRIFLRSQRLHLHKHAGAVKIEDVQPCDGDEQQLELERNVVHVLKWVTGKKQNSCDQIDHESADSPGQQLMDKTDRNSFSETENTQIEQARNSDQKGHADEMQNFTGRPNPPVV